jgi:hypothetical protein
MRLAVAVPFLVVACSATGSVILAMPTTVTSPLRTAFGTSSTNVYVGGDVGVVLWGTQ